MTIDMTRLVAVLERARAVGFIGPGPIEAHIEHAALFGRALGSADLRFADIGAGGGVPGLPLSPAISMTATGASKNEAHRG